MRSWRIGLKRLHFVTQFNDNPEQQTAHKRKASTRSAYGALYCLSRGANLGFALIAQTLL